MAIALNLKFWLLDLNPKIDDSRVELWLWGIEESGSRILIIDEDFIAYFYALLAENINALDVEKSISNYSPAVVKTEITQRRFFGKPVVAIKVYCNNPRQLSVIAKGVRKLEGVQDCLEDDIRIPTRYMNDNNINPSSWLEIEAEENTNIKDIRVNRVFKAKSPPRQLESIIEPELRVLAFSMISYSREGSPKPDRNPVIIISTCNSEGDERQFVADQYLDDRVVIQHFIEYIRHFDPDVIVSYGGNAVDWNYLIKRSRKLDRTFDVDRPNHEPHTSIYGHVSFTGLANVDLADFMDVFPEVKVRSLWNLSKHLGVITEDKHPIEDVEFADYWDNPQNREELKQFSQNNAKKVQSCAKLLLDFAIQLSSLTIMPLDHVMTAAVGFRVESFIIRHVQKIGELTPRRIEQPYQPYAGGLVLSPKPGLHEDIAVLDFKSMYPNIMITYNLSPDTYIEQNELNPPEVNIAPEVNYRFRKNPPGFYKEALAYLINVRNQIRQKMKTLNSKSVEYNVLDARQKAIKIITNVAYGYAGWIGARWYIKPVAEAASAWGRHIILSSSKMAEEKGLTVVYGDTDSLFLKNVKEKTFELQNEIRQKWGLEVEIGEVYKRVFFTEAKKRYAGLRQDDSLDIVGLEVIRGDWAEVAKKVQENVLEIILKEQSPKKAIDYVHGVISDIRQKKIPFNELVIWKTLSKPIEDYAVKASHVEAARILKAKGWRLSTGDKVGYVILKGKGRLYSRVKPYVFAAIDEVDSEYYVTNQVVPAAVRILGFFGVNEQQLLIGESKIKETKSLMDFMKP